MADSPWPRFVLSLGAIGQTSEGSFSAVSEPNFAIKYSLETGTLKLSVENEHREEKNNNYFNGVSKKKYPYEGPAYGNSIGSRQEVSLKLLVSVKFKYIQKIVIVRISGCLVFCSPST